MSVSHKDLIVTLFPQRWNQSSTGLDPLPREFKRLLQGTVRIDKGLDPRKMCHDMVKCAMQYIPLVEMEDRHLPLAHWKVFSKEVLRVVSFTFKSDSIQSIDDVLIDYFQRNSLEK